MEKFKEINFTDRSYEKVDNDGRYELFGDLAIKGIKKQIKLDLEFGGVVKDPLGNHRAAFTPNGTINRKDWRLNWSTLLEAGGVLVSEDVWISCEVQLIKQSLTLKYNLQSVITRFPGWLYMPAAKLHSGTW